MPFDSRLLMVWPLPAGVQVAKVWSKPRFSPTRMMTCLIGLVVTTDAPGSVLAAITGVMHSDVAVNTDVQRLVVRRQAWRRPEFRELMLFRSCKEEFEQRSHCR